MDCKEFRNRLEAADALGVPAELKEHGSNCASCGKLLEAHERMSLGLEINRRAVRPPNLTSAIMQKVARQKAESPDPASWLDRIVALVTPASPFKSSLFYVAAGVIVVALCHAVIDRGSELQNIRRQQSSWRLVSSEGRITGLPADSAARGVPFGTRIECETGSRAEFKLADRFRVTVDDARAVLASGEIDLDSGNIDIDIAHIPGARPFLVKTPHAEIRDVGTRFSVTVLNGSSTVRLESGRVSVTSAGTGQSRELSDPGQLTVGPQGFVQTPSSVSNDPASFTPPPDFRRIQTPDE